MSVGELRGAETYDSANNRSAVTRKLDEDRSFDEALAVANSRPPERPEAGGPSGRKAGHASDGKGAAGNTTGATPQHRPTFDSKGEPGQPASRERAEPTRVETGDLFDSKPSETKPMQSPVSPPKPQTEQVDRSAMIATLARSAAAAATDRADVRTSGPSTIQGATGNVAIGNPSVDARGAGPSTQGIETGQADARPADSMEQADRSANEQQLTSQVTVRFADADGGEGRLRVAVRGEAIRATILSGDPQTVQRLTENRAELRSRLHERGFAETEVSVREIDRHARHSGGRSRDMDTEVTDD